MIVTTAQEVMAAKMIRFLEGLASKGELEEDRDRQARLLARDACEAFGFDTISERPAPLSIFTPMLNPSPVLVDAMNIADHAREMVG